LYILKQDKNEFDIGLKEDENFRAMTKVGEFYTRFVDEFEGMVVEEAIRLETSGKEMEIIICRRNF
jgi:hypothetical protein